MARQRGKKLVSTDELAIQRNERARSATEGTDPSNPGSPPSASPPAPDPPRDYEVGNPQPITAIAAVEPSSVTRFATQMLMADTYARIAKDAGMLGIQTSEAAAKLLILRGFEMGIPPLRALNELYLAPTDHGGLEIVEEATLIRARVAKSGLGVIEPLPEQCNETIATIRAIRKDHLGRRETLFRYTLEDATHDGLMLKANWQSGANREALLIARATSKAARAWFSDVEGPRYTSEELGGGGGGAQEVAPQRAAPSPPLPSSPAPVAPPAGAGQVSTDDAAGATDAGGPHPPVAPPPGAAAAANVAPSSPPPPPNGPPPGATRQQKMAHYADVSRAMHRPWTTNVGMSRDAQPVPIISHGVRAEQVTQILNYTIAGRPSLLGPDGFVRADDAMKLVIDHLGQRLSIDTQLLPAPYCFFALTETEAKEILEGLDVFARGDAQGEVNDLEQPPDNAGYVTDPPPDPRTVVQNGQKYSWVQANDYFEAVLRRLAGHATRGDAMAMLHHAYPTKEFYELTPDELFSGAADLDRLGANPTILKQAIDRLKIARGS